MADDVMDNDGYENSFTPEMFYVADKQTDATNVPSGAWFEQKPVYAHALFSLERRIRSHVPTSLPETHLVIGALVNALALHQVRYLTLTDDFVLRCAFWTLLAEEDDTGEGEKRPKKENDEARRTRMVEKARERAVGPLVAAQLLKPRGTSINHDYSADGSAYSYFIPPFEQILDRIAKMDVEEQFEYNRHNKRLRVSSL